MKRCLKIPVNTQQRSKKDESHAFCTGNQCWHLKCDELWQNKSNKKSSGKYLNSCYWKAEIELISSIQFSRSVVSDSLRIHELQHARPPSPSPSPRVHSDSCPSSQWCHPAISSSVVPFSSCPQSRPASGSFKLSQLVASGGQSIGVSASASVLAVNNTQDWSPLGWIGWISLQLV